MSVSRAERPGDAPPYLFEGRDVSVELLPGGDRGRFCVGEKLLGRRLGWDQVARRRDRFGGRVEAGAQAGQDLVCGAVGQRGVERVREIRSARCLSSPRKLATNCRCAASVSRSASRSSVGVPATGRIHDALRWVRSGAVAGQ